MHNKTGHARYPGGRFSCRPLCLSFALFLLSYYLFCLTDFPYKPALAAALSVFLAVFAATALITGLPLFTKRVFPVILIIIPLISSLLLSYTAYDLAYAERGKRLSGYSDFTAVVLKTNIKSDYSASYNAMITSAYGRECHVRAVLYTEYASDFDVGDTVSSPALAAPSCEGNRLTDRYALSDGCIISVTLSDEQALVFGEEKTNLFPDTYTARLGNAVSERLALFLDSEASGIADALLYGDRSGLAPSFKNNFTRLGISHTLAVSGLHLGIILGGLSWLLRKLTLPKKARLVMLFASGLFYIFLTGFIPSVMRAFGMYSFMILSGFTGRRRDNVTTLLASVTVICLLSPYAVFDIGLHLSFFATLGIFTCALPLSRRITETLSGRSGPVFGVMKYILSMLSTSFFALLFTLPYSVFCFGSVSLLTIPANLIFIPLVTLLVCLSPIIVLVSPFEIPARVLAHVFESIAEICSSLASAMAGAGRGFEISFDSGVCTALALLSFTVITLILLSRKSKLWTVLPVCALIAGVILSGRVGRLLAADDYSVYIHSEKGSDAVIIRDGGSAVIIENSYGGYSFLSGAFNAASSGAVKADTLFITHCHPYLISSLTRLFEKSGCSLRCVVLYVPGDAETETADIISALSHIAADNGAECITVTEGSTLVYRNTEITVKERSGCSLTFTCEHTADSFSFGMLYATKKNAGYDTSLYDAVITGTHGNYNRSAGSENTEGDTGYTVFRYDG